MVAIVNRMEVATATIASAGTVSTVIDVRQLDVGQLFVPTGFQGASVTFQASDTEGGTFDVLNDSSGSAVSLSVTAGEWHELPAALASGAFIKIVAATAQAAGRTLKVLLKR